MNRAQTTSTDRNRLFTTFMIEGVLSFAASLMSIGIFFYTTSAFKWDLTRNFLLAAGQGVVYSVSALGSQPLARKLGRRRLLLITNAGLAVISLIGVFAKSPLVLIPLILAYVPLCALIWPVLESAASINTDAHTMSRRIGSYNLVWAATGAIAVAVQGAILKFDDRGVFFIPMVIHVVIIVIILCARSYLAAAEADSPHAHLDPEPGLLKRRNLALLLGRIALPATYVVIYTISPLMPLLPVIKRYDTATQTLITSTWLASRFFIFWLLGATVFWHTRPRLLLLASVLMLIAFLGVTLPIARRYDLAIILVAQVLLGAALGIIYTASLYFGMVLSKGSTEHAGYHESLIGVGQVVGPGIGALTQWKWPGSIPASSLAMAAVIALTIVAATIAGAARKSESS